VALVVEETPPVLMDVSEQAEEARAILNAPLRLTLPDAEPDEQSEWVFDAPALAKMLLVTRVQREDGAELHVSLDETALAVALSDIAEEVNRAPVNARFVFDEETHQLDLLESAVIGRTVDVPATVANINEEITRGIHDIPLEMTYQEPEVPDTATAGELGIRELVVEQTSYFYGSSVARIQNIQAAAARFHGLLVAPGEVRLHLRRQLPNAPPDFLLGNQYLGDVSAGVAHGRCGLKCGVSRPRSFRCSRCPAAGS